MSNGNVQDDADLLSADADMMRVPVLVHSVNRAESGSPVWVHVYLADETAAATLREREEVLEEIPDLMTVWHNVETGQYFDPKDRTKQIEVIGL